MVIDGDILKASLQAGNLSRELMDMPKAYVTEYIREKVIINTK